ncbi:hypothetical protein [Croceicoccus mobilis]|uniref:Uncharacterized protein n=1 Tax=Croceicoccus mobilis TaxID=1703339 RepID=A0A916Z4E6_9SPHN|nr:hypothetical protein [Croceicoccus mobilis]GGD74060.1 hypothetical protein GCM10010990_24630 [Croceicoccus mobilis]
MSYQNRSASAFPALSADEDRTCTIHYIVRALGRHDYGNHRRVTYVKKLVEERGLPAPFPHLRGSKLVDEVAMDSRWNRIAVEEWLHDFLPPDTAALLDRAAQSAAADDMDANAANLGLRLVTGGRQ